MTRCHSDPGLALVTQAQLDAFERQVARQQAAMEAMIDRLQAQVEVVRAAGGPAAYAGGEQ